MKYKCPEIEIISAGRTDVITLSGGEGDGVEYDPTKPASLDNPNGSNNAF